MEVVPVTRERWDDLTELFERRGPRGGVPMTAGCWCMWWRRRTGDPARNREGMRELVLGGREPGLVALEDGRAIGWVSVAPREDFGHLVRSRLYGPREEERGVWSVVCFYVPPEAKGRGLASTLAEAALAHALSRGATAVEAYPNVRPDYMGAASLFARLGFEPLREAGKRVLVRYELKAT